MLTTPPLPDLIATDGPRPGVVKRTALFGLAFVFFVLGVIFWLLPIATGIPFYIASLATLGIASRRVARWINRQETRLPYKYRVRIRKMLKRPTEHPNASQSSPADDPPPSQPTLRAHPRDRVA